MKERICVARVEKRSAERDVKRQKRGYQEEEVEEEVERQKRICEEERV